MSVEYKQLTVFVEGPSDLRLIDEIIRPLFEAKYGETGGVLEIIQYAKLTNGEIEGLLAAVKERGSDYLLLADREGAVCVTAKKRKLQERRLSLDMSKVIIVVKQIESWYLAGLSPKDARRLKVPAFKRTDALSKEDFNKIARDMGAKSSNDLMIKILACFNLKTAKQKNASFRYFVEKHLRDL